MSIKLCSAACLLLLCLAAVAQRPIGTVRTEGADLTGTVAVRDGSATIGNSGAVTAGTQPSDVALSRGGTVRICAGSQVHLSQSSLAVDRPPLMLALDRGTVEIHTNVEKTDVVLTPDLRFELSGAAPLDLRIRVVPNGDTCVDNAGKDAPMLHITETLGSGTYFLRPGQRVLFEHGSLREVVDHESSSCGCPKTDALVLAGKGKRGDGKVPPVPEAARVNPFPEAVSQGLAKPDLPQPPPAPVGEVQTQVSSTLAYSGTANAVSGPPGEVTTAASLAPPAAAAAPPTTAATSTRGGPATASPASDSPAPAPTDAHVTEAAPPPSGPNPFRAIGRFFRHIFGGR